MSRSRPLARAGATMMVALLAITVDQSTKSWAVDALSERDVHVAGSLRLHLSYNEGAAFGLGSSIPAAVVALLAAGMVWLLLRWGALETFKAGTGLGLVVGGATGNLLDRVLRDHGGAVIDFIDLQWWPVFNIADSCIVVGVGILFLSGLNAAKESS